MAALQWLQAIPQRGMARGEFELMQNLAVKALQLVALPGELCAVTRHLDFHLAHLGHQGFFVVLELSPFLLELLVEGEQFFLTRDDGRLS